MPHRISWLVKNRVIYAQAAGNISAEEALVIDAAFVSRMDASEAPLVHILANDADVQSLPSLSTSMKMTFLRHSRLGWSISLYKSPLLRMFGAIATSVTNVRLHYAADLDAALDHLLFVDTTLPDRATLRARLDDRLAEIAANPLV